ncbi:hypothetical protein HETIRDRAFT_120701 [Heterobasidion irregulare TC 32-1]|uniref:DUF6697 domain-containing protein n=1 Tax=Heterobasidion irregulare (strain TC 32-1) TaxID=747525 RepID=W4JM44_HETIT|nr:uncharacterized protein HETIRDRAFT_120701 [Heterobasidion irregulare TC 32-1]ETW74598.1 hypothetical protein HETIRDRAFT_120701 [Heterobasidion irregulare TC 32-1]
MGHSSKCLSTTQNRTEKSTDIDPITPTKQDGHKQPPGKLGDTDVSLPVKDIPDHFPPTVPLHLIRRYFSLAYRSKMDPYSGVPLIGTDHTVWWRMLFVAKGLNFGVPAAPGKDGLLLSNVTQMNNPEEVAVWAEDNRSDWIYYGQYVVTGSDGRLSKEEFSRLSERVRKNWADLIVRQCYWGIDISLHHQNMVRDLTQCYHR